MIEGCWQLTRLTVWKKTCIRNLRDMHVEIIFEVKKGNNQSYRRFIDLTACCGSWRFRGRLE
jgi:hypothetical protein